jgi:glycosyltransferase involved in cell wall biosynthesis
MKDEIIKRGISEDKVLVNPNGVDIDKYSPDIEGSFIRQKYNLKDKVVIGFIGTFGQWHGAEVLAEAFGRIIQKFPAYRENLRLFMIGDGITMPKVKENLNTYGIMHESILTERIPQEEGPVHLAACDILVAPHIPNPDGTPFFGSPTKLFEYMAMGKGIVASNLDQIGEVLEHEKTAFLVTPGDVKDLMKGICALVEDEHVRLELGKNAREEVVAQYTWKEHVKRTVHGLEEALNS